MSSRPGSFHRALPDRLAPPIPRRTESHPDFLRRLSTVSPAPPERNGGLGAAADRRLTKLLLNVTFESSLGPVHVVTSPDNTVADLVRAAVEAYVKQGRRPLLLRTDPEAFELHYSQYSLESLEPEAKLISLGSRNFFLCVKRARGGSDRTSKTISPSL